MSKIKIEYQKCIQNKQELNNDDEHMHSEIYLKLIYPDGNAIDTTVIVKQIVGSSFDNDPLEVYPPKGINLRASFEDFSSSVERYYRSLVGATGRVFRIENSSNIKMINNTLNLAAVDEIDFIDKMK